MERWGIIYSPKSGVGKTHRRWEKIQRYLNEQGVEYDFVQSEGSGSEQRLASMLAKNGYKTIIVVGGDGALNRVLNGIASVGMDTLGTIRLGVIPNGHGNDYANYWGFEEKEPRQTVEWLVKGRSRKVDLGVLKTEGGNYYFLNCVNIGLASSIIDLKHKTYRFWGLSSLSYLSSMFLLLFHRMENHMKLLVNHETIDERLMTVCIGNCRGYGMTPNAVPYSGMLDVSVVSYPAITQLFHGMGLLFTGRFLTSRNVRPYRTRQRIMVNDIEGAKVSLDGQVQSVVKTPFQVSVLPEVVEFIIPA